LFAIVDSLGATCSSSPIGPLLTGGAVAILAFGMATAREVFVRRRDSSRRQKLGLGAFEREMTANREASGNNLTLIAVEKRDLESGAAKALLNPLSRLESGAWPLARVDLPTALLEDEDLVSRLQIIDRNTNDINSLIASRETFRLQHLGQDDLLVDGLIKYASVLTHLLRDLQQRIDEAEREIAPYI